MALFAYRAVDVEGRISTGNLDAVNGIDLELRLKRLGLDLVTFDPVKRSVAARSSHATEDRQRSSRVNIPGLFTMHLLCQVPREGTGSFLIRHPNFPDCDL